MLPRRKPNNLNPAGLVSSSSTYIDFLQRYRHGIFENVTDPPLKAPTGFRTGKVAAASASRVEVWKRRTVRSEACGDDIARIAGESNRDAMTV